MDTGEAAVHIIVAAIGAVAAAAATIKAAQIQARKFRAGGRGGNVKDRGKSVWASRAVVCVIAPVVGAVVALGLLEAARVMGQPSPSVIRAPVSIETTYYPSGWMGDGEKGTAHVQLNDQWTENPHSAPTCIRIAYQPGPKGWAGVYWQYPDGNWGDRPGRRVEATTKLSFWARGERGGELIQFKVGGIRQDDKKYRDSLERTLETVALTTAWQRFEIPLKGADTSSVLGAFAWVANRGGNPNGLVFFIDDLRFE